MTKVPGWRTPTKHEQAFVASLEGYHRRGDRAALAALRRGFGKEPWEAPEMYPFVVPYLISELPARREQAFFVTASAFAQHPSVGVSQEPPAGRRNLGGALRETFIHTPEDAPATERRFVALLKADREDLTEHLWRVVTFLRSKEMDVDWRQFVHDLARPSWSQVRREWASSFWTSIGEEHDSAREREDAAPQAESLT
jgi:CRISPR type I-E-associated protein CasB/Cse2